MSLVDDHEAAVKRIRDRCNKARVVLCQLDNDHLDMLDEPFGPLIRVNLDFLVSEALGVKP